MKKLRQKAGRAMAFLMAVVTCLTSTSITYAAQSVSDTVSGADSYTASLVQAEGGKICFADGTWGPVVGTMQIQLYQLCSLTDGTFYDQNTFTVMQGTEDISSLAGAIFKVQYYDADDNVLKTWYLKSDEDGYAELSGSYIASGYTSDGFYYYDGKIVAPVGKYTVTEIKSPVGYNIDDADEDGDNSNDGHIITAEGGNVTSHNNTDGSLNDCGTNSGSTYENGYVVRSGGSYDNAAGTDLNVDHDVVLKKLEDVRRGHLIVYKWDIENNEAYDDELDDTAEQGDATLAGAVFYIYNRSENPVYMNTEIDGTAVADGKTRKVNPGEVAYKIVTDSTGLAKTPDYCLPVGRYSVEEITPPLGYLHTGILSRYFDIEDEDNYLAQISTATEENGYASTSNTLLPYGPMRSEKKILWRI